MVNRKHAFWHALVLTIVIFGLGVILGFFIEDLKADDVRENLINSEVSILDEQLRNRVIQDFDIDCDIAIENTFNFADEVYQEALQLERYDAASTFTETLWLSHKRYDLLRTLLWAESIKIRDNCKRDFHTVVYFYEYATEDVNERAEQNYFSRILADLKAERPNEVLLIPIASNMNLASVDLLIEEYRIKEYPSILIDEEEVIDERVSLEELRKAVFG